jgi:hypothetical protein
VKVICNRYGWICYQVIKCVLDKTKFLGVILIGTSRMLYNPDQWGRVKGTKQSFCSRNLSLEAFATKPVTAVTAMLVLCDWQGGQFIQLLIAIAHVARYTFIKLFCVMTSYCGPIWEEILHRLLVHNAFNEE